MVDADIAAALPQAKPWTPPPHDAPLEHYGCFSGIGAFNPGLGPEYRCTFANDIDPVKNACYRENWGRDALKPGDIGLLKPADCPGRAHLVTAGFPCTDLSEARQCSGLNGRRSGTFWPFIDLTAGLRDEGRAPTVVLLENVSGLLSSQSGRDFAAVVGALRNCGYSKIGAAIVNAADFTAQSRERVFVVAVHEHHEFPAGLVSSAPAAHFTPTALRRAVDALPVELGSCWVWWNLPVPPPHNIQLIDILDEAAAWDSRDRADALLGQLSAISRAELERARASGERAIYAAFRRTRPGGVQIECRFVGLAGSLRVASGGSSRQILIEIEGASTRTRLLTPRECARLMGLPDSFKLPASINDALGCVGDGVAVPVVTFLSENLLLPLLDEVKVEVPL